MKTSDILSNAHEQMHKQYLFEKTHMFSDLGNAISIGLKTLFKTIVTTNWFEIDENLQTANNSIIELEGNSELLYKIGHKRVGDNDLNELLETLYIVKRELDDIPELMITISESMLRIIQDVAEQDPIIIQPFEKILMPYAKAVYYIESATNDLRQISFKPFRKALKNKKTTEEYLQQIQDLMKKYVNSEFSKEIKKHKKIASQADFISYLIMDMSAIIKNSVNLFNNFKDTIKQLK
jgi:hypothetical protein